MIVGFTGTRLGLTLPQRVSLRDALEDLDCFEFHHGDCIGADEDAHAVAWESRHLWSRTRIRISHIEIVVHPPESSLYRAHCSSYVSITHAPAPFLQRNRHIVRSSHVLIAAPWQEHGEEVRSGTWSTVRFARSQGTPVVVIRPSGRIAVEQWPASGTFGHARYAPATTR